MRFRIFSWWHVHQDFQLVMLRRVRAVSISEVQVHSLDDADQMKPNNNNKVLFTVCVRISHFWRCCRMHRHASLDLSSSSPATPSPVPHLLSDSQESMQSFTQTTKCLLHTPSLLRSITNKVSNTQTVLHSITNQSVTGAGNTQSDCYIVTNQSVTWAGNSLWHYAKLQHAVMHPTTPSKTWNPAQGASEGKQHETACGGTGANTGGSCPKGISSTACRGRQQQQTCKAGTKHSLGKLSAQQTNKGNQKNRCFPFKERLKSTAEMLETKVCLICQYQQF